MPNPAPSATSPWASSGAITAPEARLILGSLLAKAPGSAVLAEGGVFEGAVPTASISGSNVLVTAHAAVVEAAGGTYVCPSATTLSVTLNANPGSGQSRYDLIVGEISGTDSAAVYQLRAVAGTASASPSVPSVPANTTPLFRVQVTNSGPQTPVWIGGFTRVAGGIRLVESGDTRVGSYTGDQRRFRTGQIDTWDGTQWNPSVVPSGWSQWSPTLKYAGAGGYPAGNVNLGVGGSVAGRYVLQGKRLDLSYTFFFGTSGQQGGAGDISTNLPPGLLSRVGLESHILAVLYTGGSGSGSQLVFAGACFVPPNSNQLFPRFALSRSDTAIAGLKNADSSGAAGTGIPLLSGRYPIDAGSILSLTGVIEVQ